MKVDVVIVGAGIAGITLARRLVEEKGLQVLIIEKRNHIGGNCFDYVDHNGIYVHQYGPHIFRTENKGVYDFLSKYTEWYDYQHKVLSYVGGRFYPIPINLDTVNEFLGKNYDTEEVLSYFKENRTFPQMVENVKDAVESQIGTVFYKAFFEQYTKKQWGVDPAELPTEIISRIPIRSNRDNRYFTVPYQGIPKFGYTAMFQKILDHPKIHLLINTDYQAIKNEIMCDKLYYSGSIDEYFNYCYGKLPYRCVFFKFEELDMEFYQSVAVVNYPNDYDYTRITEFKYFTNTNTKRTVIGKEYSSSVGDPSYPIPLMDNISLYEKYKALNKEDNIEFIGRLGQYKYFSMDQVIQYVMEMSI